jgi:hypothetical protein
MTPAPPQTAAAEGYGGAGAATKEYPKQLFPGAVAGIARNAIPARPRKQTKQKKAGRF